VPGACGGSDIYLTRFGRRDGWSEPEHFACQADGGPNGAADEQEPSYLRTHGEALLYFSSGPDIYVSDQLDDGTFGPATPVAELNSSSGDFRPNVRRNGLEIVFDSNRTGTLGGQDLYTATRESIDDPWSTPVNLGNVVNTSANETRGSFWRAETLYFGRSPGPEGSTDIYVSTRPKLRGRSHG
jgi:hypothetical protein